MTMTEALEKAASALASGPPAADSDQAVRLSHAWLDIAIEKRIQQG